MVTSSARNCEGKREVGKHLEKDMEMERLGFIFFFKMEEISIVTDPTAATWDRKKRKSVSFPPILPIRGCWVPQQHLS